MPMFKADLSALRNITAVCSQLGFSKEISPSVYNDFVRQIKDYSLKWDEDEDEDIPATATGKAPRNTKACALAFCRENNRAGLLWPTVQDTEERPLWCEDREWILSGVEQIMVLQGNNRAKAARKFRNKTPAKDLTQSAVIDEVKELNPAHDTPIIKEFSPKWLTKDPIEWPKAAQIRLKRLMHIQNWYPEGWNEDYNDKQILKIIDPLRKKSALDGCTIEQYLAFETIVRDQMVTTTRDLINKMYIQPNENGMQEKRQIFQEIWKIRDHFWNPKPTTEATTSAPIANMGDGYDIIYNPPDDPTDKDYVDSQTAIVTKLKSRSNKKKSDSSHTPENTKQKRGRTSMSQQETSSSRTKEVSPIAAMEDKTDENVPPSKRHKKDTTDLPTTIGKASGRDTTPDSTVPFHEIEARLAQETENQMNMNMNDEDFQEISSRKVSEPLLADTTTTQIGSVLPKSVKEPHEPPSDQTFSSAPSTSMRAITASVALQTNLEAPLTLETTPSPRTPFHHTDLENLQSRLSPTLSPEIASRNISTPSSSRQRLLLFLQAADHKFIRKDSQPLSSTHLRNSSVFGFFDLYAEKTKVAPSELTCLTFIFVFAELEDPIVVQRGDVEQWRFLVNLATALFALNKRRQPTVLDFLVTIEIGDKTS